MIAAELGDILSGTPFPTLTQAGRAEMVTASVRNQLFIPGRLVPRFLHPLIDNIVNGRIRASPVFLTTVKMKVTRRRLF